MRKPKNTLGTVLIKRRNRLGKLPGSHYIR